MLNPDFDGTSKSVIKSNNRLLRFITIDLSTHEDGLND